MSDNQRIMEAVIRIGGEMDSSVKMAMTKSGKAFATLNKKCASFEKAAVKAAAGAAAAFTAAAGAMVTQFIKSGNEFNKTMNGLAAQTGATGAELEALGNIARDIYKSGVGESMQEVANAISNIEQASGLAGKELETAARNALALQSTFDFDIAESTRAASALMKNFGISADEAYGIITYGAQNGANKNGDLLDTLNEYSVHYKALGLNADQFVTSLIKGAEAGSWSVDKVGDAVKEFTIRSKDASKKSLEAYQMIGLNGEEMTRAFANGGEEAAAAFKKTVKALKDMKDPVKQNAAGVMLFGTMFEDLEAGILDTMASMSTASVDAAESMQQLKEVKADDLGRSITQISRSLQDALIPSSQEAAKELNKHMPAIQEQFAKLQPIISEVGEKIATALPGIIQTVVSNIPVVINKLKEVGKWLADNKDKLLEIGKNVLIAYAAFRSFAVIAGIISTVSTVFGALKTTVLAVKGAVLVCKGAWAAMNTAQIAATVSAKAMMVVQKAVTAAQWLWNAAMTANPIGLVIAGVAALIAIGIALYKNWDEISAWFGGLWERFQPAIDAIKNAFTNAWEGIKSGFMSVFEALPAILKTPINAIISIVNGAINAINSIGFTIPDWIPGIGGKAFKLDIPKLPMLATGGFTNGASIAGEAGTEAVISFDPAYRRQNQGYLMTAAEMLGMTATPKSSNHSTYNLGGITFSPVLQTGDKVDSGNILKQLRACLPDLVDMIEDALREKEAHRYV